MIMITTTAKQPTPKPGPSESKLSNSGALRTAASQPEDDDGVTRAANAVFRRAADPQGEHGGRHGWWALRLPHAPGRCPLQDARRKQILLHETRQRTYTYARTLHEVDAAGVKTKIVMMNEEFEIEID